jgi:hypothetical protein
MFTRNRTEKAPEASPAGTFKTLAIEALSVVALTSTLATTIVVHDEGEASEAIAAAWHDSGHRHDHYAGSVGESAGAEPAGIYGADAAQEARINEAMELFAAAGLELPEITIHVHSSQDDCNGHQGLYSKPEGRHRIDLCVEHEIVIRHELAHAWENHHLDDATRHAYLDHVGKRVWNDTTVNHQVRAIEEAAWTIAWGVEEAPIQRMLRTHYAEQAAGYEILTGSTSHRVAHWDDPTPVTVTTRPATPVDPSTIDSNANWS